MQDNRLSPRAGTHHAPVLVTGGSGYLAGWIIVALLGAGRPVRATLRDLARSGTVRATLARHAPTDQLTFCAANLLTDEGWPDAVAGVGAIIHVASPMPVREYRGQDLVTPAREGTRRVLEAARRAGVRRVVMTSSTAAASPRDHGDRPADESSWTDASDPALGPYARSKTLAERDAWDLAQAAGEALALTTILPGMVQGPVLGRDVSGSLELPLRMLTGRLPLLPRLSFGGVDVREAAELHVRALDEPAVEGRRVLASTGSHWLRELAARLRSDLGPRAARVSSREAPDWLIRLVALVSADARFTVPDLGKQRRYSSAAAQALLGRPLRPLDEAMVTAAESLLAEGLA